MVVDVAEVAIGIAVRAPVKTGAPKPKPEPYPTTYPGWADGVTYTLTTVGVEDRSTGLAGRASNVVTSPRVTL